MFLCLVLKQKLITFTLLKSNKKETSIVEILNPLSGVSLTDRLSGITGFSEVKVETSVSSNTGDFAPKVIATKPLVGEMDLSLESEISGKQISSVNVEYPITNKLSVSSGWKSSPSTTDVDSGSGTFGFGFNFKSTFPGLSIFKGRKEREE